MGGLVSRAGGDALTAGPARRARRECRAGTRKCRSCSRLQAATSDEQHYQVYGANMDPMQRDDLAAPPTVKPGWMAAGLFLSFAVMASVPVAAACPLFGYFLPPFVSTRRLDDRAGL